MAGWIEGLSPEQNFQYDMQFSPGYRDWYRGINQEFGGPPNLDAPEYDTRGAWRAGVVPQPYEHAGGRYHWPSGAETLRGDVTFKTPQHPTYWMEQFMRAYGTDPNEASPETIAQSMRNPQIDIPGFPRLRIGYSAENFPMLNQLGGLR